jgi:hypothetical protein
MIDSFTIDGVTSYTRSDPDTVLLKVTSDSDTALLKVTSDPDTTTLHQPVCSPG